MVLHTSCPACGQPLEAPGDHPLTREAVCPRCQNTLDLRAPCVDQPPDAETLSLSMTGTYASSGDRPDTEVLPQGIPGSLIVRFVVRAVLGQGGFGLPHEWRALR